MPLENEIAFVSGASRGIGKEIALALGAQGAVVIGTATSESGAENISNYMKENNIKGSYNPILNNELCSGLAPNRPFKKERIHVDLGADGPASYKWARYFELIPTGGLLKKVGNMNLITKIASLVIVMLTISILLVSFGLYSMKKTGDDLRDISQTDIPLLGSITNITLIQLKQSIWFERSLMAAEIEQWIEFEKSQSELVTLINEAFDQFTVADKLIANLLENKKDNQEIQTKFLKLKKELYTAQTDYKDFSESITELLTLMFNKTITRHDLDLPLITQQV